MRRSWHVVRSDVRRAGFRYFTDRETFLVRRIEARNDEAESILLGAKYNELRKYADVDGVMLPFEIKAGGRAHWSVSCEFNVSYRSDLFSARPNVEDGPQGWNP